MSLKFLVKYFYDIMLIVLLLLVFNYYMSYNGIMIVDRPSPVKELTTYTFGDDNTNTEGMSNRKKQEFCNTEDHKHEFQILDKNCKGLNSNDCKNINCCVYAHSKENGNMTCLAGKEDGAIYNKDKYDYYVHNNKCHGKCKK